MSTNTDNIPKWIKTNLFENALHETLGDFKKILHFKAFLALVPGENYATVMIKVEIDVLLNNGDTHKESFMLKVAHDSEFFQKEMTKWDMFNTEMGMYQEVVPEFEQMYANIGLKVKFGARAFKLPTQQDYILLEDLTKRGFKNAPRQEGLDMDHCKAVLKKMAQWHAASAVRINNKGAYEYKYSKGMFIENGKDVFKTMLDSSLKHLLNAIKKSPNLVIYLQQLEDLKENLTELFYMECARDEQEFNVLNHGDCWSNNIMFQYDNEGKLQETYFVDLQVPSYGSPAQDLLYFIITSAQLVIKINKFDYMIKYYYDHLIDHLKLLKYEKSLPKLKDIYMSIIKHGKWGLFSAIVTMPAVLCDPSDKASVDNLVGDSQEADKFKEFMYSNELVAKHLQVVLPWFNCRGVLEP
ncbi:uncharacterized protein LOC119607503 [Lucilia sericata]|uniref:uncharacterized protein LOC119607503 n=1 Tax=Lucilia sericata TaxID=13632 RepID=UPI0018A82478|nr:uncharacterized protein LOC119607503 [Lucilia sericata]